MKLDTYLNKIWKSLETSGEIEYFLYNVYQLILELINFAITVKH